MYFLLFFVDFPLYDVQGVSNLVMNSVIEARGILSLSLSFVFALTVDLSLY